MSIKKFAVECILCHGPLSELKASIEFFLWGGGKRVRKLLWLSLALFPHSAMPQVFRTPWLRPFPGALELSDRAVAVIQLLPGQQLVHGNFSFGELLPRVNYF